MVSCFYILVEGTIFLICSIFMILLLVGSVLILNVIQNYEIVIWCVYVNSLIIRFDTCLHKCHYSSYFFVILDYCVFLSNKYFSLLVMALIINLRILVSLISLMINFINICLIYFHSKVHCKQNWWCLNEANDNNGEIVFWMSHTRV